VNNDGTSVQGSSPSFLNEAGQDFRLANGSSAINSGTTLNPAVLPAHNVIRQYVRHQTSEPRLSDGMFDIGAFEFQSPPTGAGVSITGRVVTAYGTGVMKAYVTLTGLNGETRTVLTNPFGYYRFTDITVGTYIISVSHKSYNFSPQVLTVMEKSDNVNFVAGM
jgi:hypothetical protein